MHILAKIRRFLLHYADFCYNTQIFATIRRFLLRYADFGYNTQIFPAIRRFLPQYADICCNMQNFAAIHRVLLQYADVWQWCCWWMSTNEICHVWMRHPTHMNDAGCMCWCLLQHILFRHIYCWSMSMNKSCPVRMSRVTSWHTFKWYEYATSYTNESCHVMPHLQMTWCAYADECYNTHIFGIVAAHRWI